MNRIVYSIDKNGFIIDSYVGQFDDDGRLMTDFPNAVIEITPLPQPLPFFKPKWNDTEWVEGESQSEREERESLQLLESLNPTEQELLKAERELETIELLLEMGLI